MPVLFHWFCSFGKAAIVCVYGKIVKGKKRRRENRRRRGGEGEREEEGRRRGEREEELGSQCLQEHALVTRSSLKSPITSQQHHRLGTKHLRQGPLGDSHPNSSRADRFSGRWIYRQM